MKIVFLSVLLVLSSYALAMAKAGPPIPKPKHSLTQAVHIVETHFRNNFKDGKRKDFIAIQVQYINIFGNNELEGWSWIVTFRHLVHTDNSFTFRLTRDGKVVLLQQTE